MKEVVTRQGVMCRLDLSKGLVGVCLWIILATVSSHAQNITVTGLVKDESGVVIVGANVKVKGTMLGTTTDLRGRYKIDVAENATLVFSFIGFKTQEKIVDGQTNINVTLFVDMSSLQEVVINGNNSQPTEIVVGGQNENGSVTDKTIVLKDNSFALSTNTPDTITIEFNGSSASNAPAEPSYVINNEVFTKKGDAVEATFTIEQVDTSKPIEMVSLYIGTTSSVDTNHNVVKIEKPAEDISDINDPIKLSIAIPKDVASKGYVFARVGVKTAGDSEMQFSPVRKIRL